MAWLSDSGTLLGIKFPCELMFTLSYFCTLTHTHSLPYCTPSMSFLIPPLLPSLIPLFFPLWSLGGLCERPGRRAEKKTSVKEESDVVGVIAESSYSLVRLAARSMCVCSVAFLKMGTYVSVGGDIYTSQVYLCVLGGGGGGWGLA